MVAHCLLCLAAVGAPAELHVAPAGNDSWSGAAATPRAPDGPLATLAAALAKSRERPAGEPLRIVVHPGQYFLEATLQLTARDAGLSIEAAQPGTTTLLGGRAVTGWEPDGERFYAADLPAVRAGTWDFRFLVVNGRLCDRARLPAEGGFEHENEWTVPWMSTTGGGWKRKPTEAELTTLQYRAGDLGPWLETRNAEVTVYHMWDESLVPVKAVDHATRTITFGSPAGHPPGAFGRKKYVVWNTREGLTQPGQWYLDRARGKVVYWPRPGEDMRQATALAPTLETLISIAGDNQTKARDLALRGLTLALTNTPCKAGGFGAGHYRGAIEAANAENLTLERLEIRHVGGQGMKLQNVNGSRITGCQVHHLGACGIRISGNDTTVSGCHIHNIGLAFPSAIALSAGGRGGNGLLLTDNVIHDTPYSGITCGGDNHRIERNLIYRCMRVLHDGAAIYVSMCRRIRIARNVARDIATAGPGYGASAYYLDEQAEECLVEDNVAVDVEHPSHNHMAWNNTLRGNVFVSSGNMKLSFAKSRDYTLTDNTLVLAGELAITTPEAIIAERGNRVFRGTALAGAEAPLEILAALPLGAAPKTLPAPPPAIALRAAKAPAIDGQLATAEWPAPAIPIAQTPGREGVAGPPASLQALYDERYLYLTVQVPLAGAALRAGEKWRQDDGLELCLRPPGEGQPVYVLQGFAGGAWQSVTDGGVSPAQAAALQPETRYAASATPTGWQAEWRVPLAALGLTPKPNSRERLDFNLCVYRAAQDQWLVWCGTHGEAWRLDQAGWLILQP